MKTNMIISFWYIIKQFTHRLKSLRSYYYRHIPNIFVFYTPTILTTENTKNRQNTLCVAPQNIAKYFFVTLIWILRYTCIVFIESIRPLLGPSNCRFYPGCTQFALDQLNTQPLLIAIKNSMFRVLSCNPFASLLR